MTALVIVESPAKAKTISRILGKGYLVEASYGHIRDLPSSAAQIPARFKKEEWARLGVNVDDGFEPLYITPSDKKKYVKQLKEALKKADRLLLATDEDREGESISWHVVEVLKPKVPVERIAFHEITPRAIREAVEHPRQINDSLVRAQESRRVLDRLFGYSLSPLLWKKVARGLSAGRVQSVAVRLCVMRERERIAFREAEYWDAEAELDAAGKTFKARLVRLDGKKVAVGADFEQTTGQPKRPGAVEWIPDEARAREICASLVGPWRVHSVEEKPQTWRPAPPFTTSSLQQEANRKLGFSARHTMRVAQRLYEGIDVGQGLGGLITYMRTDSVVLSETALGEAEKVIRSRFGDDYHQGWRQYKTRTAGAQEAHEAIRPTDLSRRPEDVAGHLGKDEARLYELIWKRTIASQMADAQVLRTSVEVEVPRKDGSRALFAASGKTIRFPGYLRAYVEGSDDPDAEIADRETFLPPLKTGQELEARGLEPLGHRTLPPARYTEATLVKKLEGEGIGRPSTYATIIETIQARGYVRKRKNALVPTFTAFAVTQLLEQHFAEYVDTEFTARLEEQLDEIAQGKLDWRDQLRQFYLGEGRNGPGLKDQISQVEARIEYPAIEVGVDPASGEKVIVKVGRYGPYLQMNGVMASISDEIAPDELDLELALELIRKKQEGPRLVGVDPETGLNIYAQHGRFGPYVQLGESPKEKGDPKPRRASLPAGVTEDTVDLALATKLLSLPRTLGQHPDSGEDVIAAIGRFGPYIKCGDDSRSLRSGDDDVYTITLERALEILARPKRGRGRRAAARTVLKDLGQPPTGAGPVQVLDGPYGPYITNGELNAKLPEEVALEDLSLEQAAQILATRGKAPKRRARSK
ncbi:MAG: type I DNA topoisomerase [Acidobacteriota bacterium]|nr:type I DNA topoisomerase [Acidobacteriota bacterium]